MTQYFLPSAVLLFGLVALFVCVSVLKHHNKYWMAEAIVIITIPIAITLVVFLLVAKVVPENTKELVAILAGIVGFIFGYASNKRQA